MHQVSSARLSDADQHTDIPLIRKWEQFTPLSVEDKHVTEQLAQERVRRLGAHEDLIQEGDKPKYVNLILSGMACRYKTLEDGRRQITGFFVAGDICDQYVYILREMDHSVATLTDVVFAEISPGAIQTAMNCPQIREALLWDMLANAAIHREWIINLGQRTAFERVGHLICELFLRLRAVGLTSGNSCELALTQVDLADAAGLSTVHVNRTLQELRAANLIQPARQAALHSRFRCAAKGSLVQFQLSAFRSCEGFRRMTQSHHSKASARLAELCALPIETVGIVHFDADGKITQANDAFLHMSGFSHRDIEEGKLHRNDFELSKRAKSKHAAKETKAKKHTTPFEGEYIRKDGSRWCGLVAAVHLNGKESTEFIFDITQHKQAESRLHESEERYRNLVMASPDALVVHRDGQILYANPAAIKLYGARNFEQLAAHNIVTVLVPEKEKADAFERMQQAQAGQTVPLRSGSILRLDGREVSIESIASPVDYEGKKAVQVIFRDMTGYVRAENALRASEERYRNLVNASPDAIVVHRDGNVLYANPAALELYGARSIEQLAMHNIMDLVPDREKGIAAVRMRQVQEGYTLPLREGHILRLDGREVPMESIASPVDYEDGRAYQIILRDITERVRIEKALRESEARFSAILEQLPVGVGLFDCSGRYLARNGPLRQLWGEIIPSSNQADTRWQAYDADGHPLPKSEWPGARAIRGDTITPGVDFIYTADEEEQRWMRVGAAPFRGENGEIVGAVAVVQDIDKEKRAQQALRNSEARLKIAVDLVGLVPYAWNPQNRRARLGCPPQGHVGPAAGSDGRR